VGGDGRPDEVGRLASTMNRMLARLEQANERQRRFLADVSHDLRSPLTAQRTQLELAQAEPGRQDPRLWGDLLANVDEMDSLVGDLLFVVTEDERPRESSPVDLEDIVLEEAARVRRLGGPAIDTSSVSAAPVVGDAAELRRLVRNLVENAVQHAATRIELLASADPTGVVVEVADDGPGVPEGQEETVFERFHRADAARSGRGTGLGLSIARTIATRHGGTLVLARHGPGACFRLTLPPANPLP
jgi:signal transduction histidine kinase